MPIKNKRIKLVIFHVSFFHVIYLTQNILITCDTMW